MDITEHGIDATEATKTVNVYLSQSGTTFDSNSDYGARYPKLTSHTGYAIEGEKVKLNFYNGYLIGRATWVGNGMVSGHWEHEYPINIVQSITYRNGYELGCDSSDRYALRSKTSTTSLDLPSVASEMYNKDLIEQQQIIPMQNNSTITKQIEIPTITSGIEPPKSIDDDSEKVNDDSNLEQKQEQLKEITKEPNILDDKNDIEDEYNEDNKKQEDKKQEDDNKQEESSNDNLEDINEENITLEEYNVTVENEQIKTQELEQSNIEYQDTKTTIKE